LLPFYSSDATRRRLAGGNGARPPPQVTDDFVTIRCAGHTTS
jgi:hypothetical protein